VRNVEYRAGHRRAGRATKSPFRLIVRSRARKLTAFALMRDGRRAVVTKVL
jgi:hypothetical protein